MPNALHISFELMLTEAQIWNDYLHTTYEKVGVELLRPSPKFTR